MSEVQFKDSGVDWVGEVPESWKVSRLKDLVSDRMGGDWGSDAEGPSDGSICLRIADFDYAKGVFQHKPQEEYTYRCYSPEKFNALKLRIGDLLVEKSGGGDLFPVGRAVRFDLQLDAAYANFMDRLRARESVACSAFLLYQWNVMYSSRLTYSYLKQTTGIQNLQLTDLLNEVCFVVPPLGDQHRIVNYLDEETAAIDARVAVLEKKLAACKRLKTSIINQAVTHGLDPNVKLKDSGVDWIGQVPEGWKVQRLKDVVKCNCDVLSEDTKPDFEFDYVDIGSVKYGQGIISCEHIVFADAPSRARRLVISNDIIVSTVRTYLKAVAKIHEFQVPLVVSTGFAVLRALKCYYQYLNYLVLSDRFVSVVEALSTGTGYPAISASNLINIIVAVPPLTEQKIIADYLDAECAKIDRTAEIVEKQIDAYMRLKRSLINEVVTGKRKVA